MGSAAPKNSCSSPTECVLVVSSRSANNEDRKPAKIGERNSKLPAQIILWAPWAKLPGAKMERTVADGDPVSSCVIPGNAGNIEIGMLAQELPGGVERADPD